jgi:DNA-binding transcriptional regulator WhiA
LPSFASELRRQLAARAGTNPESDPYRRVELAGLVDAAGESDVSGVTVRTPSAAVARSVVRLWRSEFGLEPHLDTSGPDRFGRARYAVRVEGNRAIQAAEELRVARERALREASRSSGSPASVAYLKGAFQGAGSVTQPDTAAGTTWSSSTRTRSSRSALRPSRGLRLRSPAAGAALWRTPRAPTG